MSPEIRTWAEGTLRWVEASGTGVFTTGATVATGTGTAAWQARSGLLGFVQAGMQFSRSWRWATIEDRGTPSHHKYVGSGNPPATMTFRVMEAVTADWPSGNTAVGPSSLGFSNPPRFHFEFRQSAPEGSETAIYHQLAHAVIESEQVTENPEGNIHEFTVRTRDSVGPTGSGYLS